MYKGSCKISLYGVNILVKSNSYQSLKDFEYTFRHYLNPEISEIDAEYEINHEVKGISIFHLSSILKQFIVFNACCVKLKDGRVIMVAAPPYSGKTSFIIDSIEAGGKLVTDDVALINIDTLQIYPLRKTICLRSRILNEKQEITKKIIDLNLPCLNLLQGQHGNAYIVHPFDIFNGSYVNEPVNVTELIVYSKSNNENINISQSGKCLAILPYNYNGDINNMIIINRFISSVSQFHMMRHTGKQVIKNLINIY